MCSKCCVYKIIGHWARGIHGGAGLLRYVVNDLCRFRKLLQIAIVAATTGRSFLTWSFLLVFSRLDTPFSHKSSEIRAIHFCLLCCLANVALAHLQKFLKKLFVK